MIVRGRCRVPPPPLLRWQPADLRGWLFGVALCTRTRRPHCVKEKRREAILVLSPKEALHTRTEAPHGFAWMGQRLICFSVCKLRHQQRISKGMAQRNRKWPNRVTGSLGHLQKWRSNQDRNKGWARASGELRQHQVSSVPLALSVLLRGRTSHHHLGTLSSQRISLHHQLLLKDVQICSKMYKGPSWCTFIKMYTGPTLPLQGGWEASAGALSETSLFLLPATIKE